MNISVTPSEGGMGSGIQVARLGDLCTGHIPFIPRHAITASETVLINNRGVHRVTDKWEKTAGHPHLSMLLEGSSTVFVNNLPMGRVGDIILCGSKIMTGSENVYSG